jgi:hypothetical protein
MNRPAPGAVCSGRSTPARGCPVHDPRFSQGPNTEAASYEAQDDARLEAHSSKTGQKGSIAHGRDTEAE